MISVRSFKRITLNGVDSSRHSAFRKSEHSICSIAFQSYYFNIRVFRIVNDKVSIELKFFTYFYMKVYKEIYKSHQKSKVLPAYKNFNFANKFWGETFLYKFQ